MEMVLLKVWYLDTSTLIPFDRALVVVVVVVVVAAVVVG